MSDGKDWRRSIINPPKGEKLDQGVSFRHGASTAEALSRIRDRLQLLIGRRPSKSDVLRGLIGFADSDADGRWWLWVSAWARRKPARPARPKRGPRRK